VPSIVLDGSPWLDGLGEWSWPGGDPAAPELAPAPWVPAEPSGRCDPPAVLASERARGARFLWPSSAHVGLVALAGAASFVIGAAFAPAAPREPAAAVAVSPLIAGRPFATPSSLLARELSGQLSAGLLFGSGPPLESPR
jgi:hypothetical protein